MSLIDSHMLTAVRMACAAYYTPTSSDDLRDYLTKNGLTGIVQAHSAGNGASCQLVEFDDMDAVAIRGTEPNDISDLRHDADVWPTSVDSPFDAPGKVHRGFYEYAYRIYTYPLNSAGLTVEDLAHKAEKPVIITGHSLGAAAAVHIAAWAGEILQRRGKPLPSLYMVGCPNVANAEYCEYVNSRVAKAFSIVNHRDPVTLAPMLFSTIWP
ncbi:lipase family protein, partial [Candidatus Saccharibacteria bacterium]|nr:lipase family protein [Candidatus Saccharibacteria bacterium]